MVTTSLMMEWAKAGWRPHPGKRAYPDPQTNSSYQWGTGKEEAILDTVEFANYWEHNEYKYNFDYNLFHELYSYVKVGVVLQSLAISRKYQKTFRTFKQFCEKHLKMSVSLAKKYMTAAEVWLNLAKASICNDDGENIPRFKTLPQNMSQACLFNKCEIVEDELGNCELYEKWERVLNYANAVNKGQITANLVSDVLECNTGKKRLSLGLSPEEWQLLEERAGKAGISKQEFLKRLIKDKGDPPEDYECERYTETDYFEDMAQEIIETPEAPKKHQKLAKEFIRLLLQLEVRFEGLEDAQEILANAEASEKQRIEAKNFIDILECLAKATDYELGIDNFNKMPENRGIP